MKPPGKIRKAPDFARILKGNRTQLAKIAIIYRGYTWRLKRCGHCQSWFWKRGDERQLRANTGRRNLVYCSKPCQREGYRLLLNARQRRYQRRKRLGLI